MAAPTNVWEGTVVIAEYESTHHDGAGDWQDDWQDGFASDYIDTDQYTDGTDALLNLIGLEIDIADKPEIKFTPLPSRKTLPIGIGKSRLSITLTCMCIDNLTASKYAEEYVSDIENFARRHDKTSDNKIYFVVRRVVSAGTWKYKLWENSAASYASEFIQVKIENVSSSYIGFGEWEVTIKMREAWI